MPLDIEPELVGLGGARHDRLHLLFRQAKSKVYARPADSSIFPTSRQSNCTCPANSHCALSICSRRLHMNDWTSLTASRLSLLHG